MHSSDKNYDICQICDNSKPLKQLLPANMVRGGLVELIRKNRPDWDEYGNIYFDCLNRYRTRYVQQFME